MNMCMYAASIFWKDIKKIVAIIREAVGKSFLLYTILFLSHV